MTKENKNELQKITKSAGIAWFGALFYFSIAYISTIMITRFIGSESYGFFLLAFVVINIGVVFSKIGLDNGVLRFISFYKAKNDSSRIKGTILFSSKIVFFSSIIIGILLFILSKFVSLEIFKKPDLAVTIKFLIICLPFIVLSTIWTSIIRGFQAIKYQIYIEKFITPISRLIFLIAFFLLGLKLFSVIFATIFAYVISSIFSLFFLKHIFLSRNTNTKPIYENKKLMKFSTPLFLEGFLSLIINWTDIIMIGYFLSISEVGIYGASLRVSLFVLLFLTAINTIFAPIISELHSKGNTKKIETLFKIVTRWIFSFTFPVVICMVFFSRNIMNIFGPGFMIGYSCLIVLSIARLIDSCVGSVGYIIMMTGKSKIILLNSAIVCILNIILNYQLIPIYGIFGAALASGISIALINILRLIEVYYFYKIHPYDLSFFKPLISGIGIIIFLYLLCGNIMQIINLKHFILLSIISFIIYFLLLILFKFEEEDKFIIRKILSKLSFI